MKRKGFLGYLTETIVIGGLYLGGFVLLGAGVFSYLGGADVFVSLTLFGAGILVTIYGNYLRRKWS